MKNLILILLICTALISITQQIGKAPQPYCQSKPLYKQFPMVPQQIISHDMDTSFSGYNLKIELTSNNSFATLNKKIFELDRRNTYLPSIISHYVEHKDNGIGQSSFILYKDLTGTVHFTYGRFKSKNTLPDIQNTAVVTTEKNVKCFDAALFLQFGLAIIDCAKIDPNTTFSALTNVFYYLDLTSHTVIQKTQNDMFVSFADVTKRKLTRFKHPKTGYTYLLRTYFADGVTSDKDNTYMQIFGANEPTDLQILSVIDRTYLHQVKLSIADVKLYLDDIFLLDSNTGLYRLDILQSQRVLITGKYKQNGMTKFSVYSDDLQNQVIIALTNGHNIYEIDWHNILDPVLITKYTLIEDSKVKQLIINDKYVVVQSTAKVSNDTASQFEIDYTWVFTKGSRTYMNSYLVINHNSTQVQLDFDKSNNHLYTADEGGLVLYQLDQARINLHYINTSMIGKQEDVIMTATSTDFNTNKTVTCTQKFTVIFSQKQSTKIWPTGYQQTSLYSANFPGQLHIDLDHYFIGPNMSYELNHMQGKQIPQYWINKLNKTNLTMNSTVRPQDITFFHTDVIPRVGEQIIIYYFQDSKNDTYVAQCHHDWQSLNVPCRVQNTFHHDSRIKTFATAYFQNEEGWEYYYLMVLSQRPNEVRLIDFIRHNIVTTIRYNSGFQGQVTNIATSNGFLYILRKNVKTIDVYSLTKCMEQQKCKIQFEINAMALKPLGIDYFAPQHITTDLQHPQILFIKCLGSVILLDIDNKQKITVMDQIISEATKDSFFKIAVNQYRMLIVAQPNLIQEYSLETVYQKDSVTLMKTYPTYGYRIQPNADIQFSDRQYLVYVNAFDPVKNVSVILVYRSGFPGSNVLFDVVYLDKLYSRPGFEIEVSGFRVDFLSIISGNQFHLYRVFQDPNLALKDTFFDYRFSITVFNPTNSDSTVPINVTIVNWPDEFTPTAQFNSDVKSLKFSSHGNYQWQDRKWWKGNVINYNYSCEQCPKQNSTEPTNVKLRQHIDNIKNLQTGGRDFTETMWGGLSVWNDLFSYRLNGSIKQVMNLPDQKLLQTCLKVSANELGVFAVTACQQLGKGINLYMTSMVSFKAFTWGPFRSSAYYAQSLQVINDVLMLVDQNAYPHFKLNNGKVFLYQLSVNHQTLEQFDLLDEIDNNDFMAAHGWTNEEAYIGNAHLVFSSNTNAYRLYVTQIDHGFFVLDFTRSSQSELHLLSINYIDMNSLLKDNNLHMPYDATYQGITFTGVRYNPHLDTQNVVITTRGYHNFEVTLVYDDSGHVKSTILHRVYYRYGFYQAYNQVKAAGGYLAVGYTIASLFSPFQKYGRQYVAIYDTNDYQHQSEKGYSERYMIGAYKLNHREPCVFAFNTTYDVHSNGTRTGLIVGQPTNEVLRSASLSKNLSIQLSPGFKDQQIKVKAYSDFHSIQFVIPLKNDEQLSDSIIVTLVIILAAILLVFFSCYICSVLNKKKKQKKHQERQSLLTQNQSFINQSTPKGGNQAYKPPQSRESGYSSQDEQEDDDDQEEANNLKSTQIQSMKESVQTEQTKNRESEARNQQGNEEEDQQEQNEVIHEQQKQDDDNQAEGQEQIVQQQQRQNQESVQNMNKNIPIKNQDEDNKQ